MELLKSRIVEFKTLVYATKQHINVQSVVPPFVITPHIMLSYAIWHKYTKIFTKQIFHVMLNTECVYVNIKSFFSSF